MSNTTTNTVFQLSALSQNDNGAADGNAIFCKITNVANGTLRTGSFPVQENVALPTPPGQDHAGPTPTWFLVPDDAVENTSFDLEISCPSDAKYPVTAITVKASDVKQWAAIPYDSRDNQIYQGGAYGVFGFAQEGPNGLIYTVTAGVLNPQLQG